MRVLAMGSSNTRLGDGYLSTMAERLAAAGRPVSRIDNLSLGATPCLMGIELLQTAAPEPPDLVVIEYTVTDYSIARRFDLWRAAYEGLVRQVVRRWPSAPILCVTLGRQGVNTIRWRALKRGVAGICAHYAAATALDVEVRVAAGLDAEAREALYADPLHYAPEGQRRAGEIVAEAALKALARARPRPLRRPLDPIALDPVAVVEFARLRPGDAVRFASEAVSCEAVRLPADRPLTVDLPGPLISVSFVSAPDAASLQLTVDGETTVVDTLHERVADGRLRFMPLIAPCRSWSASPGPRRLTLSVAENPTVGAPSDWRFSNVRPSRGAVVYPLRALVRLDPR